MATTPSDSRSTSPPASLIEHQQLLARIDEHACIVLSEESDPIKRNQLIRLFADEIGCPLTERAASTSLARAQGHSVGVHEPRRKGERMDTTPTPWVWEGIVMAGTFNLLVAPPKVGKSALMVGMLSAWWHGEEHYLGQPLHGACPPVFIVGTDQPENDWNTLFRREGLVDDAGALAGPIEMLWHAGAPLHLTEEGIQRLAEVAQENPGSFFLVDSYHACVSPLGIDEATSAFDGPARRLTEALTPHRVTLVLIHHTNKSVSGGNAINASRGSNSLPSAASLTILMNWLKQPAEGQTQSDYRVVLKTQGRAKGATLLAELHDDGWISHGEGDAALQAEALAEAQEDLAGRQADAFDYIADRWELGEFPVSGIELAAHLNLPGNKANRCVQQLVRKGLIEQVGLTDPGPDGGRPSCLWKPMTPLPLEGVKKGEQVKNPSRTYEIRGYSPISSFSGAAGGGGLNTPPPGTPVERLIDGQWLNGWVVQDASNPNAVTIAKLGQPTYRIRNLRWEMDVRCCTGSPFSTPQPPVNPLDDLPF
jgi:hypothetical protein